MREDLGPQTQDPVRRSGQTKKFFTHDAKRPPSSSPVHNLAELPRRPQPTRPEPDVVAGGNKNPSRPSERKSQNPSGARARAHAARAKCQPPLPTPAEQLPPPRLTELGAAENTSPASPPHPQPPRHFSPQAPCSVTQPTRPPPRASNSPIPQPPEPRSRHTLLPPNPEPLEPFPIPKTAAAPQPASASVRSAACPAQSDPKPTARTHARPPHRTRARAHPPSILGADRAVTRPARRRPARGPHPRPRHRCTHLRTTEPPQPHTPARLGAARAARSPSGPSARRRSCRARGRRRRAARGLLRSRLPSTSSPTWLTKTASMGAPKSLATPTATCSAPSTSTTTTTPRCASGDSSAVAARATSSSRSGKEKLEHCSAREQIWTEQGGIN
jgi:hypothetical protein